MLRDRPPGDNAETIPPVHPCTREPRETTTARRRGLQERLKQPCSARPPGSDGEERIFILPGERGELQTLNWDWSTTSTKDCWSVNTESAHSPPPLARSTRNEPRRSTKISISWRPLSAVAAAGSPRPVFLLTKCQGRVMLIQPRLMASSCVGAAAPSSAGAPVATAPEKTPGPGWSPLHRRARPAWRRSWDTDRWPCETSLAHCTETSRCGGEARASGVSVRYRRDR